MPKKAKKNNPDNLARAIQLVRMGLGLPIIREDNGKAPIGYKYKGRNQRICVPDVRMLRVLRRACILKDQGVTTAEILNWIYRNTKQHISGGALYTIYYARPVYKEIDLPLHERRKIYQNAFSQAEKEEEAYPLCDPEADEKAEGNTEVQGGTSESATGDDYSI